MRHVTQTKRNNYQTVNPIKLSSTPIHFSSGKLPRLKQGDNDLPNKGERNAVIWTDGNGKVSLSRDTRKQPIRVIISNDKFEPYNSAIDFYTACVKDKREEEKQRLQEGKGKLFGAALREHLSWIHQARSDFEKAAASILNRAK